jgi:hypothetical protein
LLLSIVALADCSCEDFAISRKVKHREPDGGSHNPTRDFFFKVLFFEHVKNCKLHKTRPDSFFAQINHLVKAEAAKFKVQRAFTDPPQADQS